MLCLLLFSEQVQDYLKVINHPMDLGTMGKKVDNHEYTNFVQFYSDFELIVNNCLTFNNKETMFYRAALKLRDQVKTADYFCSFLRFLDFIVLYIEDGRETSVLVLFEWITGVWTHTKCE